MRNHLITAALAMTVAGQAGADAGPRRTVDQAIKDASKTSVVEPGTHSHWLSKISRGTVGRTARRTLARKAAKRVRTAEHAGWRHNLTTTTASGYTNAYDWLAKAMGQGPSFTFASAAGAATASSATTLTNSGAAFPTSGQGLAGSLVIAYTATPSMVYGVIVSNTATVLTVDQWTNPTSTSGAAGTTPSGTGQYMIVPGQNPAAWMAVTANTYTPATSDTTLAGELTSNGFTRAVGTYSHTAAASTYTLVHLWTATGTETINNEAQFGAANTTAGGVMPFESAEPSPPTLVSGDTLQNTVTISI